MSLVEIFWRRHWLKESSKIGDLVLNGSQWPPEMQGSRNHVMWPEMAVAAERGTDWQMKTTLPRVHSLPRSRVMEQRAKPGTVSPVVLSSD